VYDVSTCTVTHQPGVHQLPVRLSAGPRTPRRPCGAAGSELKLNPTPMGTGWGRRNGSSGVVDQAVRADHMGVSRVSGRAVRCGTMRRPRPSGGHHPSYRITRGFASRTNDQPAGRRRRAAGRTALYAAVARVPRATHASRPSLRSLPGRVPCPWPPAPAPGKRNVYLLQQRTRMQRQRHDYAAHVT